MGTVTRLTTVRDLEMRIEGLRSVISILLSAMNVAGATEKGIVDAVSDQIRENAANTRLHRQLKMIQEILLVEAEAMTETRQWEAAEEAAKLFSQIEQPTPLRPNA